MDKKEYLNILLKRDFIRYALLQEPVYTASQISHKLKERIDADLLYRRIKDLIPGVIERHLPKSLIKDDTGRTVQALPDGLDITIAEAVVADFRQAVAAEYSTISFMPAIMAHIERLTWAQGVDDMAANLRTFVADLQNLARHYADIQIATPDVHGLAQKYEAAKHISVKERIMRDNDKDIEEYFEALTEYCCDLCGAEVALQLSRLYADLSASAELSATIARFDRIRDLARQEIAGLPSPQPVAEWDAEYARIIPVSFFERNVEDISACDAFQMALFQAFARHEDALREQGYINSRGELVLFTNTRYDGARWTGIDFSFIYTFA